MQWRKQFTAGEPLGVGNLIKEWEGISYAVLVLRFRLFIREVAGNGVVHIVSLFDRTDVERSSLFVYVSIYVRLMLFGMFVWHVCEPLLDGSNVKRMHMCIRCRSACSRLV